MGGSDADEEVMEGTVHKSCLSLCVSSCLTRQAACYLFCTAQVSESASDCRQSRERVAIALHCLFDDLDCMMQSDAAERRSCGDASREWRVVSFQAGIDSHLFDAISVAVCPCRVVEGDARSGRRWVSANRVGRGWQTRAAAKTARGWSQGPLSTRTTS